MTKQNIYWLASIQDPCNDFFISTSLKAGQSLEFSDKISAIDSSASKEGNPDGEDFLF